MQPHPLIAAVSAILLFTGLHALAQDQNPDAPAAPPVKIATVDMQELFKQYHRTNEAQKQINVERARIQKDNNEHLARIRELETNLGNLKKQIEDPSINESKKQTPSRIGRCSSRKASPSTASAASSSSAATRHSTRKWCSA
jgi:Skp family chaperone for outer membrane proteins